MLPPEDQERIQQLHRQVFDETYKVEIEVLEDGKMPFKAHKTDAGFDLFATDDVEIQLNQVTKHPLNFKMKLPKGTYAQITSKSGLGSRGLLVYAGIIDEGYRGIPHVVCTKLNHVSGSIIIKKGSKLAQMIVHPYSPHYFMEQVEAIDTTSDRGEGGFGSTGE